jgi:undecaprenyl diphosphate synthase
MVFTSHSSPLMDECRHLDHVSMSVAEQKRLLHRCFVGHSETITTPSLSRDASIQVLDPSIEVEVISRNQLAASRITVTNIIKVELNGKSRRSGSSYVELQVLKRHYFSITPDPKSELVSKGQKSYNGFIMLSDFKILDGTHFHVNKSNSTQFETPILSMYDLNDTSGVDCNKAHTQSFKDDLSSDMSSKLVDVSPLLDDSYSSSLYLTIQRQYWTNLLNDGHMLVVGLPFADSFPMNIRYLSSTMSQEWLLTLSSTRSPYPVMNVLKVASSQNPIEPLPSLSIHLTIDMVGACGDVIDVSSPTHDIHNLLGMPSSLVTCTAVSVHKCNIQSHCHSPNTANQGFVVIEPNNIAFLWPSLSTVSSTDSFLESVSLIEEELRKSISAYQHTNIPSKESTSLLSMNKLEGVSPPLKTLNKLTSNIPRHVAVVMDGNGRWATQRGLPRSAGHEAGVETIHRIIRACRRIGIQFLTLYAFSTQNWSRPGPEVRTLMSLLNRFVSTDCSELVANGVKLLVVGDLNRLPSSARTGLERLMEVSKSNSGLTLILALSYGGREEIVAVTAKIAKAAMSGDLDPNSISPNVFQSFLQYPSVPDPDLFLRTSGEFRISNFLLWQIAYSEIVVSPVLWPDFDDNAFINALLVYAKRERRFGRTSEQVRQLKIDEEDLWNTNASTLSPSGVVEVDQSSSSSNDEDPTAPKEESYINMQPQQLRQRLNKPKGPRVVNPESILTDEISNSKASSALGFPSPFTILITILTSIATYFILHSLRAMALPFIRNSFPASPDSSLPKVGSTFPATAEIYGTSTGRPSAPTANVRTT